MLSESMFFLVAAGATYRILTKDMPPSPSRSTSLYYAALLIALGFVMWALPGQGLGR
jgi:hypothetical protein